ncbi:MULTISPECIES: aldose 1-epimerase family protein [unclassified Clostridium]|uniref:aldose 1-epimerase family protein n=1 Tax=unclassified Clostridium TaxID=2614128 RepID=UPI0002973F96|nr:MULTISPECIES: aldose 1-epimerase family protein [unclassified Clostridium]EKQ56436.1 MAG: galactose mutarotase-like enzyme [Clostridium sp. Maddingley MBC34-26]
MIYCLENERVRITASTDGGELHSITGKKEETEYLWNGNPEYWKYHSPHLFPIIGQLNNSKYRIEDKEYQLPSHGFARISEFTLLSKDNDHVAFELKYSDKTLEVYPYKFSLQITYTLEDNSIVVGYKVINFDDKEIYFSLGAHPAFMCPIEKGEALEDYYLKFNKVENSSIMCFDENVYFTHNKKEYLINSDIIELKKEVFKNDALVFNDLKSNKITIKSRNNNKSLSVEFDGFPYLGIWAPAKGAPFVCIEPWFGHADYGDFNGDFKEKEGIISLEIGKEFNCIYKISIEE